MGKKKTGFWGWIQENCFEERIRHFTIQESRMLFTLVLEFVQTDNLKKRSQLCQVGSELQAMILGNLGDDRCVRYRRLGNSADLSAAVDDYEQALSLTPVETIRHDELLNRLASARLERFLLQDTQADFSAAIDCCQKLLERLPDDLQSVSASVLDKMATLYMTRYKCVGEVEDLSRGMDCLGEAVRLTSGEDPVKLMYLVNLGAAHAIRRQRNEGVDDGQGER